MPPNIFSYTRKIYVELIYNPTLAISWKEKFQMSQIENHHDEVSSIEIEIKRHMIALGLDWKDEVAMMHLAAECKAFGPIHANAAYASHDRTQKTKAELFALASLMLRTMENAARENRLVHAGDVWKALGKHLYNQTMPKV